MARHWRSEIKSALSAEKLLKRDGKSRDIGDGSCIIANLQNLALLIAGWCC